MKQKHTIQLTDEQRLHLESLIRAGTAKARTLTRARILLMADRGQGKNISDGEIAEALLISVGTVLRIRHRFINEGMESALSEKPRPGRVPKITGDMEAKLTVLACSDPPEGRSRWTLRLLADQMVELACIDSISHVAIYDRLKKMRSSPGK